VEHGEDPLNVRILHSIPSRVDRRPVIVSGLALFALSIFVLNGIRQWLPTPTMGQREILVVTGTLAIAGWCLLVYQLLRGWVASEQRSRSTFEQAMAGIGLIDDAAQWIDVNEKMAALTGYTVAELRGRPLCDLLLPAERDGHRDRMRQFLGNATGPAEYSVESRWRCKDGTTIWLSRHVRRIPVLKGTSARAMMMVLDVSDRKLAEERALEKQSVESFQFANSPVALVEWGPEMRVRRWSKQAEAMFGWAADEVVGRTLREAGLLFPDEIEQHEAVIRDFVSGTRDQVESLRKVRRKDGGITWCRWFSRVMRHEDGTLHYLFSAGIDVSELRQALEAVEAKEGELRAIFEQASVGVAMLDEKGRWLSVNQRVCEITGYSREELLRIDFQTITHPEDLDTDVELARQVASGERRSYTLDKRYLHRDGQVVWTRLHVGRIDASGRTPMRYVSVIEDISERKRLDQEAVEHRLIRDFHVENSPLAVIEWTPDLNVASWSRRAEQIFGWTSAEVLGRHFEEFGFLHEPDKDVLARWAHQVQVERRGLTTSLHRNVRKDGRPVWIHWYNSILYTAEGAVRSIYSLADDVTEEQSAVAQLKESQAQFRSVFEQAAVGIALVDTQSRLLMVNRRFSQITGYESEMLRQTTCVEITHPEDRAGESALRERLIHGEIDDYRFEKRYCRANGSIVWVSIFARKLEPVEGEPVCLALVVEDISERMESAHKLKQLHVELESKVVERTRQLQETTRLWADRTRDLSVLAEMMSVLPAARDASEGRRIIASFLPRLFGGYAGQVWMEDNEHGTFDRLAGWNLGRRGPPALRVDDCWALRRGQTVQVEDPNDPLVCAHAHDPSGFQTPHVCVPVISLGDLIGLIHLSWTASSELTPDRALLQSTAEQIGLAVGNVRLREELRRQAVRDPLTGLFNRRHFEDLLQRRFAAYHREAKGFSLLLIDIDHFKAVNDRLGHDAGDEVLRAVGVALQKCCREDEGVFRLGGEEFVVMLEDPEGTKTPAAAERVRSMVENLKIEFQHSALHRVTVSVGAARCPDDAMESAVLIRRADQAMYEAKRAGRNRVCLAGSNEATSRLAVLESRAH